MAGPTLHWAFSRRAASTRVGSQGPGHLFLCPSLRAASNAPLMPELPAGYRVRATDAGHGAQAH